MTPHILFKFASRSRPEKFFKAIDNIINMIDDKVNYTVLCTFDKDDVTMNESNICDIAKNYPINIKSVYGNSANKIHAINRDMHLITDWDILINMSDDMMFLEKGFDNLIREDFAGNFDQFLHYNDGNQKANVSTMTIMGRQYYDRFNYIYHPAYISVWCDVEQTDVAVMLGKYKYMGDDKKIFIHNHPAWGLTSWDAQYRASENLDVWGKDLMTIIERKEKNYGLHYDLLYPKYPMSDIDRWIADLNQTRIKSNLHPIIFER